MMGPLIPELTGSRFNLLEKPEKWVSDGPRRAGINAFGFGGSNAHLIIEEWRGQHIAEAHSELKRGDLVLVGVDLRCAAPVTEATPPENTERGRISEVGITLKGLKFPLKDLQSVLPQQALMFASARAAFPERLRRDKADIGVFVGMSADANISRYVTRLRLPIGSCKAKKTRFTPPLDAACMIGVLGNVVANRINSQMDIHGPGIAIAAEEASGLMALKIAVRAVCRGNFERDYWRG
ncbi:MAG: beta-ketoacyl synthase N-terminal-like domain-containing protein [Acetobacteraceae bacterium]